MVNQWMRNHGGYDYIPDPLKPMDPRFHPLAQPGHNGVVYRPSIFRYFFKIHPRIRMPVFFMFYLGATRELISFTYPWGPRDENNVRVPYDDPEYFRPWFLRTMGCNSNSYYARRVFKDVQDRRMAEARRQGLVE